MIPVLSSQHLEKLAAAKLWLISDGKYGAGTATNLPYLATALYSLVPVPEVRVARLSVDPRWRLYVNPDWLDAAEVTEVGKLVAALTWHLLLEHSGRAQSMFVNELTAPCWRLATKLSTVDVLGRENAAPEEYVESAKQFRSFMPKCPIGLSAEEYFSALGDMQKTQRLSEADGSGTARASDSDTTGGSGVDGITRPYDLPSRPDLGEQDAVSTKNIQKSVAIEYREWMKGRGTVPGEALRWADQILEPKIAWEQLLKSTVRRAVGYATGRVEHTWSRPSRRQSAVPDFAWPGMRRPLPRLAMVIDTSGSVDDQLLGRALGEVGGALRALGMADSQVTVFSCDSVVAVVGQVRSVKDITLIGGGGTDMTLGIEAAAASRPKPMIIVVFTDGWTPWPAAPPPGIEVIVALLGRQGEMFQETPAWAKRIECRL